MEWFLYELFLTNINKNEIIQRNIYRTNNEHTTNNTTQNKILTLNTKYKYFSYEYRD